MTAQRADSTDRTDRTDLLGRAMTDVETQLLEIYEKLTRLLEEDDLPPIVEAAAQESVATLWQAVQGLALRDDRPNV